jgi:hypothetical protein
MKFPGDQRLSTHSAPYPAANGLLGGLLAAIILRVTETIAGLRKGARSKRRTASPAISS